mmetsp:Transcript_11247/g.31781  ORF Transcript_11247/g.31781 Transcript_11247/m.31781 type:complete len:351 (-) Transcript_11247:798-1850(-)
MILGSAGDAVVMLKQTERSSRFAQLLGRGTHSRCRVQHLLQLAIQRLVKDSRGEVTRPIIFVPIGISKEGTLQYWGFELASDGSEVVGESPELYLNSWHIIIQVVHDHLVVRILILSLIIGSISEIITQWRQDDVGPVQRCLLLVLIQQKSRPLGHVGLCYSLRFLVPGTATVASIQPSKVKLTAHAGIRTTRMRYVVRVEGHDMREDVLLSRLVVGLTPHEFQMLPLRQLLFDCIVDPLDEHPLEPIVLENVCHGWGIPERIDGPAVLGNDLFPKRLSQPIMTLLQLDLDRIPLRVGFVRLDPPTGNKLQLTVGNELPGLLLRGLVLFSPPPFKVRYLGPYEFPSLVLP